MIFTCPPENAISVINGSDDFFCWLTPKDPNEKCKSDQLYTKLASKEENKNKLFLRIRFGEENFFCQRHKLTNVGCIAKVSSRRVVWRKSVASKEEFRIQLTDCLDMKTRRNITRERSSSVSSEGSTVKLIQPGSPKTIVRHRTVHNDQLHAVNEPQESVEGQVKLRNKSSVGFQGLRRSLRLSSQSLAFTFASLDLEFSVPKISKRPKTFSDETLQVDRRKFKGQMCSRSTNQDFTREQATRVGCPTPPRIRRLADIIEEEKRHKAAEPRSARHSGLFGQSQTHR